MHDIEIGGAIVRRRIDRGTLAPILAGTRLTRAEVIAWPAANRRAMIDSGQIAVYPISAPAKGEMHIIARGAGKFDVISGTRVNDRPLSKDEAEDLATRPN